jgi:FlaG/FlaF family flagellin (archaellin)
MNHTTKSLAIAVVGMLAIAAALIGAVGISISIQSAAAQSANDPRNSIDLENSETNFDFKQKLKNNCSGFANCTNTAQEALAGIG